MLFHEDSHQLVSMIATKEESNDLHLLRESQILKLIPVSRSTFRRWVKAGEFPAGFKVSERITMWPSHVVSDWIKRIQESPEVRQW